ncbi:UBC-like protein [Roridomyces roridus]|uniref:UBC-like protein n=1 Tax=Roridomyces roridus TaxID=1738132 RepID=A0AAD7FR90_9AGAR|nr:UBC-like protein [Roridomyces roridus]
MLASQFNQLQAFPAAAIDFATQRKRAEKKPVPVPSDAEPVTPSLELSLEYASLWSAGHCPLGIYVVPSPETLMVWDATFFVHQGYYADAIFKFRLTFPVTYPAQPPSVHFNVTTDVVFHPLISHSGVFNLAPRFRPWRCVFHRVFDILHYIKAAFKKHTLDALKESECFNKEAYRLYHESTSSFANLASQSSMLSQSAPALFGDHPPMKGKPRDAMPFREMSAEELQAQRTKLGLKEWATS